jgi:hypothetical protein
MVFERRGDPIHCHLPQALGLKRRRIQFNPGVAVRLFDHSVRLICERSVGNQRRTYLIHNFRCASLEIERSAISVIADHLTLKSCHGLLRWLTTEGE